MPSNENQAQREPTLAPCFALFGTADHNQQHDLFIAQPFLALVEV